MAMSLNRAQIIGNLTRDPEMRQTPNGSAVVSFGVATNFRWTDQSGEKKEKVEFHNIVAWRRLAEICGQYLKRGSKVFIEGRIQTQSWEGEDGQKRSRTEIVADSMIMLDSKGAPVSGGPSNTAADFEEFADQAAEPAERKAAGVKKKAAEKQDAPEPVDEDIPIEDLPF
jgi:single-strand DNA-binding protein